MKIASEFTSKEKQFLSMRAHAHFACSWGVAQHVLRGSRRFPFITHGTFHTRLKGRRPCATWDPEGILPSSTGGHFSRRERAHSARLGRDVTAPPSDSATAQTSDEAAALLQAALSVNSRPVQGIPTQWQQQGGIPGSETHAYERAALRAQMESWYMPVDLDSPGLRILHLDPPIFTVHDFFTAEQCQELIDAASSAGSMQASKIGAGNAATVNASNTYHSRRTSTSMVIEHGPVFRSRYPRLAAMARALQQRGLQVFGAGEGEEWGTPGRLPVPQQYAYEGLQVTRYEQGQHFLAHEDAFPPSIARQNKFNRTATLLVYLNDVERGGATRFDQLGLAVRPRQGMALLFFPSYSDGTSDARTLHTADAAVDVKWVTQQWVARGLPQPGLAMSAGATSAGMAAWGAATSPSAAPVAAGVSSGKGDAGDLEPEQRLLHQLGAGGKFRKRERKVKGGKGGAGSGAGKGFGRK